MATMVPMLANRLHLLLWCLAVGLIAFALLNYYSQRRAPLYKRFERQWAEDVRALETSGKLPPAWKDVKEIKVIGGTPETKAWLKRIEVPLKANAQGTHTMDVLVVIWEENGKRGALVQYNIEDGKTRNMLMELGRTLILSTPATEDPLTALKEALSL